MAKTTHGSLGSAVVTVFSYSRFFPTESNFSSGLFYTIWQIISLVLIFTFFPHATQLIEESFERQIQSFKRHPWNKTRGQCRHRSSRTQEYKIYEQVKKRTLRPWIYFFSLPHSCVWRNADSIQPISLIRAQKNQKIDFDTRYVQQAAWR